MDINNISLDNSRQGILHFEKKLNAETAFYKEIIYTTQEPNKFTESEKKILAKTINSKNKTSKLFNNCKNFPVVAEVAASPTSEFELISNLDKFLNNYSISNFFRKLLIIQARQLSFFRRFHVKILPVFYEITYDAYP